MRWDFSSILGWRTQSVTVMQAIDLTFRLAIFEDFEYIYGLCDTTMRAYVEADWGDCFEEIARPTISTLIMRCSFWIVYANGVRVGAVAVEQHETHFQLEELYLEPSNQNRGIGAIIVRQFIGEAISHRLPIRLNVLASNRARAFYERLGFSISGATKAVYFMEWGNAPVLRNEK